MPMQAQQEPEPQKPYSTVSVSVWPPPTVPCSGTPHPFASTPAPAGTSFGGPTERPERGPPRQRRHSPNAEKHGTNRRAAGLAGSSGVITWLAPGPSRASATILETLRRDPGPQPREVMPVELVVPFATRFGHGARSRRRFDARSQASPFRALLRQPLRLGPPPAPCPALRASEPAGGSGCGLIGGPMSSPSPPAGHPLRASQASRR